MPILSIMMGMVAPMVLDIVMASTRAEDMERARNMD